MTNEQLLNAVLDVVKQYMLEGQRYWSLPVLRGDLLEKLVEKVQDRETWGCSSCGKTGTIEHYEDKWKCPLCDLSRYIEEPVK